MDVDVTIESTLAALRAQLEDLERRVTLIEEGRPDAVRSRPGSRVSGETAPLGNLPGTVAPAMVSPSGDAPVRVAAPDVAGILALVGRSLIVLGGAFLLRALTESGTLPALPGALAALVYAVGSVAAADRAGALGRSADAGFHGLTGAIIGYPLIAEATVRFGLFSPVVSAGVLGLFTTALLVVAWRQRERTLAWIATLASLATVAALVPTAAATVPFVLFLTALGIATLWLGYVHEWTLLRWPVAAMADLVAVGLILRALAVPPREHPSSVVMTLLTLVCAYLAVIAIRTLLRDRSVIPFEVCQTALSLIVGLGGSIWVLQSTAASHQGFGALTLLTGVATYAVALSFVDRRPQWGRNLYFYTSLAVVFTLTGAALLLKAPGLAWFSLALAGASAWLGLRYGRLVLGLQAVLYLVVSVAVSGDLAASARALSGGTDIGAAPSTMAWLTAAVALGIASWRTTAASAAPTGWSRIPRIAMLGLALWLGGGSVVAAVAQVLNGQAAADQAGTLATIRTVVLSLSALLLGVAGRGPRFAEATWFVYPVLLLTGLRILLVDLRTTAPSLLVVALGTYGLVLILAPRLARRRP